MKTETIYEQAKFSVFAVFIAACFALGFYAGEALARLSSIPRALAAEVSEGTSSVFVRVITSENGSVDEKTFFREGSGSVSVSVDGSKVEVNGESAETDGVASGAFIRVEANASGADGEDGKSGEDGEDGKDGEDGLRAGVSAEGSAKEAPVLLYGEEKDGNYPLLSEIVEYVVSLFAF